MILVGVARDLVNWWLAQLTAILPEAWRSLNSRPSDAVVIASAGPLDDPLRSVTLIERRAGEETVLGQFSLAGDEFADIAQMAGRPVVLRLAEGDVLGKTLSLPLAAERQLGQVLAFEMDRETPFAPEEVFWNHHVVRRDRKAGQVWVRLLLVPKTKLAQLLGALDHVGIRPRRIELAEGPNQGGYLPLDEGLGSPDHGRRWLLRRALACCLILALAAAAIPFARQAIALASIEREIAADRVAVADAEKLRREIDRLSGSADLVAGERAKAGEPLAILAALTRLLPSDTYMTDLTQQQGKVTLAGRSASTSRLIAILSESRLLHDPAFAAPVTRMAAGRLELFTITAAVAP